MQTTFEGFLKDAMVANPRRNADILFTERLEVINAGGVGTISKLRPDDPSLKNTSGLAARLDSYVAVREDKLMQAACKQLYPALV